MKILLWLATFMILVILLLWMAGQLEDKRTDTLYARAHLSEIKNEGRKDLMAGLMPYTVIAVSLVAGTVALVAMTWGMVAIVNRPLPPERHILEKQVFVMLQPGQSQRDFFRTMEDANVRYYRR